MLSGSIISNIITFTFIYKWCISCISLLMFICNCCALKQKASAVPAIHCHSHKHSVMRQKSWKGWNTQTQHYLWKKHVRSGHAFYYTYVITLSHGGGWTNKTTWLCVLETTHTHTQLDSIDHMCITAHHLWSWSNKCPSLMESQTKMSYTHLTFLNCTVLVKKIWTHLFYRLFYTLLIDIIDSFVFVFV